MIVFVKEGGSTMLKTILSLIVFGLAHSSLTAQQEQPTGARPKIVGAQLGKSVLNREIMGEDSAFTVNDKVYLLLKVAGGAGDSLTVTWKQGEHSYPTNLGIGGNPWRTWAYKTTALAGDWTVTVADSKGNILREMNFKVSEATKGK